MLNWDKNTVHASAAMLIISSQRLKVRYKNAIASKGSRLILKLNLRGNIELLPQKSMKFLWYQYSYCCVQAAR